MCRWAAYIGRTIFLEEVISSPLQSLMAQSLRAHEAPTETNGDGFGIAWYGDRDEPGLYRDVLPAWSDANLLSIARQVRAGLFLAHVRAATGTATSRTNCHPFAARQWSFMHNGQFGGYAGFRRTADMMIADDIYSHRNGTTDSEALFLLALGSGLDTDPKEALEDATGAMERLSRDAGITPHVRLSVAMSDGDRLFVARYASDERPPTLYHRRMPDGRAVVSEPLDRATDDWELLPHNSFAEITVNDVLISEFRPKV